ncbi:hypothetical protein EG329_012643 [Mollisiaceae sp. DMI_Dod_QoI]|nr:hypothetical protein EG329_012643 [Helotiales sp. DMI_Dod_QoI]
MALTMQLNNPLEVRPALAAPFLAVVLLFSYLIWTATYNVFFHPLRKYPGPKLWSLSRIPLAREYISGYSIHRILDLHKKYGDIVRIAPNELSYSHPNAWNDIYGHRKRGEAENGKDHLFYERNRSNIIGCDRETHSRFRRILSNGFSTQAMLAQESIIKIYVDQFIHRLHEKCQGGRNPLNIVSWFNYTTFDVIGDLAFGEPFGCLDNADYHPWVAMIFLGIKAASIQTLTKHFWLLSGLLKFMIPKSLLRKRQQHLQMTHEKMAKRKAVETSRPDFAESMLRKAGPEKLSDEELDGNASILIVAGSETTATALSGAMYFLTTNPSVMARLVEEVRTTFKEEVEINMIRVQGLSYLNAILEETLRIYPPVPVGLPRKAPANGAEVLGQYVPPGTLMSVWQWPTYHNSKWFSLPNAFIPERWLGDPRFENDRMDALQPFSTGPRNCIGKNLAYAEMRLMLCRTLWNFDVQIAEESHNWLDAQQSFLIWQKGPMDVYLTPRKIE